MLGYSMNGIGWVSVHRQVWSHWVFKNKPFNYFSAWIDLLLLANHEDNKFPFGDEVVKVKRGSFITSELKLMDRWGWSKSKVRRFLKLLQNDSMIVKKTDHKKTTITICNYDTYQDAKTIKRPLKDHQETIKRPLKDTNNNDNNDNNENNSKAFGVFVKMKELQFADSKYVEKLIQDYFLSYLPEDSTQQFIEAWCEWVDFRKELKKKLTKTSAKKQIRFLLQQSDPIKVIEESIKNQWQGLFEVKDGTNNNSTKQGADDEFLARLVTNRAVKQGEFVPKREG